MSAYSTLKITRSRAKLEVMNKLLNMNDRDLEHFMDQILEPRLYNCRVVDDWATEHDDDAL